MCVKNMEDSKNSWIKTWMDEMDDAVDGDKERLCHHNGFVPLKLLHLNGCLFALAGLINNIH